MKPFLTAHFQMPEAGKVLFVPFPKLRTMAIQVKHTTFTRPLLQQCPWPRKCPTDTNLLYYTWMMLQQCPPALVFYWYKSSLLYVNDITTMSSCASVLLMQHEWCYNNVLLTLVFFIIGEWYYYRGDCRTRTGGTRHSARDWRKRSFGCYQRPGNFCRRCRCVWWHVHSNVAVNHAPFSITYSW